MTVLIDPPRWPAHGRLWSHLISDASLAELHGFARTAGIPRRAFSGDHYDVPQERYAASVAAGASPVEARDLLARLVASGLRVPKRRGEHLLTTHHVHDWLPGSGPGVLDLIASKLPVPAAAVVSVRVVVLDPTGRLLLVRQPSGWTLPSSDDIGLVPLSRSGFHRLRLDGDPSPAYAGPRPWAYVTYATARPDRRRVPGARWVDPREEAVRAMDVLPLLERVLDAAAPARRSGT